MILDTDRINEVQFAALATKVSRNPAVVAAAKAYIFTGASAYAAEKAHNTPPNTVKRAAERILKAHRNVMHIATLGLDSGWSKVANVLPTITGCYHCIWDDGHYEQARWNGYAFQNLQGTDEGMVCFNGKKLGTVVAFAKIAPPPLPAGFLE